MKEEEFWGRPCDVHIDLLPDNGQSDETELDEMTFDDEGGSMQPVEVRLPDTNPKSRYGVKKVSTLSCIPATAILAEGKVMMLGRTKYGPFNWRDNNVSLAVYIDAAMRHLMLLNAGEDTDDESLQSHAAHVRACMGIIIDAMELGCAIDDRPKDEATIRMIKEMGPFLKKLEEVEKNVRSTNT